MKRVPLYEVEKLLQRSSVQESHIDNSYLFEGYPEAKEYIQMAIVRALLYGGLLRYMVERGRLVMGDIGMLLGIGDFEEISFDKKREALIKVYQKLKNRKYRPPYILERNVQNIAKLIGLSPLEQDVLILLALFSENEILETFGRSVELNFNHTLRIIAVMVGCSYGEIKQLFLPSSKLLQSGIIKLSSYKTNGFLDFFDFGIGVTKLFMEHSDVMEIFKEQFLRLPKTKLQRSDYDYMDDIVTMISKLLKSRLAQRRGAHILLYGKAGYGKSEFVKLLAKELHKPIYEISYLCEDGRAIDGEKRLEALYLSTLVLSKESFILFDEFDDIDDRDIFNQRLSRKAWLNRFLERRSHIIFWVANSIDFLDEAMIRRFDLVFEMPDIPKKKRIDIAKRYLPKLDNDVIEFLAAQKSISVGVLAMLGESIQDSGLQDRELIVRVVNEKLKAQGYKPVEMVKEQEDISYRVEYINAEYDLFALAKFLKQYQKGRLCFYGAPGTGKSAYAKYLARYLKKELIVKRASDLLSMWVGKTEANIQAAFEEARREDALLLIDEADSFLADRTAARQSWEVTQVNEMLTQIERFDGIFIATTNFLDYLDSAALRRFDLKISFKPLLSSQLVTIFEQKCRELGFVVNSKLRRRLEQMDGVTLGDVSAVVRGSRLAPLKSADDFFHRLVQEVDMRQKERIVGF